MSIQVKYDPDILTLHIQLHRHPGTDGCVVHTEEREPGVMFNIGEHGDLIGIEVELSDPLEILTADAAWKLGAQHE